MTTTTSGSESSTIQKAVWQEVLAQLVADRPCLWNKAHPDFNDFKNVKQHAWQELAQTMIDVGFPELGNGVRTSEYPYNLDLQLLSQSLAESSESVTQLHTCWHHI